MKVYLVSLLVGVMVGVIYGTLGVRSPAPPVVALIGLLGMLIGARIPPLVKHTLESGRIELSSRGHQIKGDHLRPQVPEDRSDPALSEDKKHEP